MRSRGWIGWIARLLPALLCAQLTLSTAAPAATVTTASPATTASTAVFISSPRESLPRPIHDEATCAFCQAAAFAPHSSRPVETLTIETGDEQRIQFPQHNPLTTSASARPARSRAPPVTRSV